MVEKGDGEAVEREGWMERVKWIGSEAGEGGRMGDSTELVLGRSEREGPHLGEGEVGFQRRLSWFDLWGEKKDVREPVSSDCSLRGGFARTYSQRSGDHL